MPLLALTDAQLDSIMTAAQPLALSDRALFLAAVADALGDRVEPGDGDVHRAVREAQRRFWHPPDLSDGNGTGSICG